MKKLFIFIFFMVNIFAATLVTGEKKPFIPGDKILFFEDFNRCPVGEIPESFDKIDGIGECVKLNNNIWFTSSRDHVSLIKNIDLSNKEFSIEYDIYFLKGNCRGIDLSFFKQKDAKEHKWSIGIGPGCSGEAVYIGMEKFGRIYKSKYKSLNRKLHIAIQVRRGLLRIYFDNKRLTNIPFKEKIKSIKITIPGEYHELIDNIKIATYSKKEEAPKPEKLGIEVKKIENGLLLRVPAKILFDFNKFVLKPKSKEALESIAYVINQNPDKKILIIGYTDNVGSDEYNLKLSLQRAQSVADYLIYCLNVNPDRLKIEGKGKADPIADNSTEEGRAKNRRVEIKLTK